jgi:N-methylhydantoinase A
MASNPPSLRYLLGVDVGGTFTDIFCLDCESGRPYVAKAPSTPATPGQDVIDGIRSIAQILGFADERALLIRTKLIFHGSTVATNTMLTLAADPVGLLTTRGFRDILELRGGIREEVFNNRLTNAVPLSPRHLRYEVTESVDRLGDITHPVDLGEVDAALAAFKSAGVRSIAICFKNAYANSAHEELVAEHIRALWPEVFLTESTKLTNRARLYDRVSSAVINSFVGPTTGGYIQELQRQLRELGFIGRLLILGGHGGVMSPAEASRYPAKLILSGPAGGPVAGELTLAAAGRSLDGIVVDMGGTSFDVSVIRSGRVPTVNRRDVNRYRISVPMLDIHTLAAGGGSIAWLDQAGLLKVGPHSAGSVPGPSCYGLGGEEPTVTDANVVLGYMDPGSVLGGTRLLQPQRAARAISARIADPLGLSLQAAAAGIHRVATANMIAGVREMTVERGLDPRPLPLILAGGAAGLHGAEIAEGLGMEEVIVPRHAGVFCALGMALSTLRYDYGATLMRELSALDPSGLRKVIETARERLLGSFAEFKSDIAHVKFELEVEARYVGQFHELNITVGEADLLVPVNGHLRTAFHDAHMEAYGFNQPECEVEVVNLRVTAVGVVKGQAARTDYAATPASFVARAPRQIWDHGAEEWRSATSYMLAEQHDAPTRAASVKGPALIDLPTSTVLVPPCWDCSAEGNDLLLTRAADA